LLCSSHSYRMNVRSTRDELGDNAVRRLHAEAQQGNDVGMLQSTVCVCVCVCVCARARARAPAKQTNTSGGAKGVCHLMRKTSLRNSLKAFTSHASLIFSSLNFKRLMATFFDGPKNKSKTNQEMQSSNAAVPPRSGRSPCRPPRTNPLLSSPPSSGL